MYLNLWQCPVLIPQIFDTASARSRLEGRHQSRLHAIRCVESNLWRVRHAHIVDL